MTDIDSGGIEIWALEHSENSRKSPALMTEAYLVVDQEHFIGCHACFIPTRWIPHSSDSDVFDCHSHPGPANCIELMV